MTKEKRSFCPGKPKDARGPISLASNYPCPHSFGANVKPRAKLRGREKNRACTLRILFVSRTLNVLRTHAHACVTPVSLRLRTCSVSHESGAGPGGWRCPTGMLHAMGGVQQSYVRLTQYFMYTHGAYIAGVLVEIKVLLRLRFAGKMRVSKRCKRRATDGQIDTQTDRRTDGQIDTQTHRRTDRHTHTQTHTHPHTPTHTNRQTNFFRCTLAPS